MDTNSQLQSQCRTYRQFEKELSVFIGYKIKDGQRRQTAKISDVCPSLFKWIEKYQHGIANNGILIPLKKFIVPQLSRDHDDSEIIKSRYNAFVEPIKQTNSQQLENEIKYKEDVLYMP